MKQTKKSICGTHYHYIDIKATAKQLTALLGEPEYGGDKTTFEWSCETSTGDVFTVYDYRSGGIGVDTLYNFHIGAFNIDVARQAQTELLEALNTTPAPRRHSELQQGNPYLDMDYKDRTKEVEALTDSVKADLQADPDYYAELIADMYFHWKHNTRETSLMVMFAGAVKNKK